MRAPNRIGVYRKVPCTNYLLERDPEGETPCHRMSKKNGMYTEVLLRLCCGGERGAGQRGHARGVGNRLGRGPQAQAALAEVSRWVRGVALDHSIVYTLHAARASSTPPSHIVHTPAESCLRAWRSA